MGRDLGRYWRRCPIFWDEEPVGMLGVGLAALIGLVLRWRRLRHGPAHSDLRVEKVRKSDEEGYVHRERAFAYVRRDTGKVKKSVQCRVAVGDRLEKKRGEAQYLALSAQS